jgi:hypothetical protein
MEDFMAIPDRTVLDDIRAVMVSASLPVWATRATGLLLPQGVIVFLIHLFNGFQADHASFPLGLKLDPLHSIVHIVWGAIGVYVGFFRPRWAVPYLIAFGVYYIALATFGAFTDIHFGLQLGWRENLAHWTLGPIGLIIGLYGLWRGSKST